jgi:hypothetical protein
MVCAACEAQRSSSAVHGHAKVRMQMRMIMMLALSRIAYDDAMRGGNRCGRVRKTFKRDICTTREGER